MSIEVLVIPKLVASMDSFRDGNFSTERNLLLQEPRGKSLLPFLKESVTVRESKKAHLSPELGN